MSQVFVIAEVGINHNGSLENAIKLINIAKEAGADAVKFQKRTIDKVYSQEELNKYRESPWGTTNRQQKEGLEFGLKEYQEIDRESKAVGIEWFATPWDLESFEFLKQFDCKFQKVASARLTHLELLTAMAKQKQYTFISTGMSTLEEIEQAVKIFRNYNCPFELMHCNSQYPCPDDRNNLSVIKLLRYKFECDVGYSCHSTGIVPPALAVMYGATSIEKHITLDRALYGSDQSASVEPGGFKKMIEYIRLAEAAVGNGKKLVSQEEFEIAKKLRRTKDY